MTKQTNGRSREIVRDLIKLIRSEGLGAGDRLPSIRQLSVKLGTGTTAVRDAMVQAQAMGLVKIHPRSGAFVGSQTFRPLISAMVDTMETSLLGVDHNLFDLLEARQLIEGELVGMAAERRRVEDLLPVQQALEAMSRLDEKDEPEEFAEADAQFHLRIAEISGNRVLAIFLKSLLELMPPNMLVRPKTRLMRERTAHSHAEIYEALTRGDAEEARRCMREHLGMAREMLLTQVQNPVLPGGEPHSQDVAEIHA